MGFDQLIPSSSPSRAQVRGNLLESPRLATSASHGIPSTTENAPPSRSSTHLRTRLLMEEEDRLMNAMPLSHRE